MKTKYLFYPLLIILSFLMSGVLAEKWVGAKKGKTTETDGPGNGKTKKDAKNLEIGRAHV